jgi:putative N6-adenine-specific DNA methylase
LSKFFVTCARGVEEVTERELTGLGVDKSERVPGGVYFEGNQDTLYLAHLWLRTGNRILLPLRSFPCRNPEELYENLYKFKWETFLRKGLTFAVDCTISGRKNPALAHSHYAKLKAKDAIVDRMRERTGGRPDVDADAPDISVVLYIRDGVCTLNMDATGPSLHERGYRAADAEAPLKESLAAALLLLLGWDGTKPLVDPMCGSGTLLAEAALIATNTAPGSLRDHFLFMNWPDFHSPRWETCLADAKAKRREISADLLFGYDQSEKAVQQARRAMKSLGLSEKVKIERRAFSQFQPPAAVGAGMLIMNPPYGDRLGSTEELRPLYKLIGDTLKQQLKGWRAGIFTGSSDLAKSIGLRATRRYPLWNGPIECRLLTYEMY